MTGIQKHSFISMYLEDNDQQKLWKINVKSTTLRVEKLYRPQL